MAEKLWRGIPITPQPPESNDATQPSAAVPPAPGSSSGPVTQPLLHVVDTPDVKQVRDKLGLTLDDFAALLSSSARSVSGWENGQSMSPLAERVFREVKALIDRLAALADPARFSDWLKQPNPTFGGVSPIQLIKSGQMYRLWGACVPA
jgi:hypothetical protein